jgi:hypothetical protein
MQANAQGFFMPVWALWPGMIAEHLSEPQAIATNTGPAIVCSRAVWILVPELRRR